MKSKNCQVVNRTCVKFYDDDSMPNLEGVGIKITEI